MKPTNKMIIDAIKEDSTSPSADNYSEDILEKLFPEGIRMYHIYIPRQDGIPTYPVIESWKVAKIIRLPGKRPIARKYLFRLTPTVMSAGKKVLTINTIGKISPQKTLWTAEAPNEFMPEFLKSIQKDIENKKEMLQKVYNYVVAMNTIEEAIKNVNVKEKDLDILNDSFENEVCKLNSQK